MNNFKKRTTNKTSPQNNNPKYFVDAFKKRLGRTPNEYISEKIKSGSHIDAVKYLFNVVSAEISNQNNCKFFDFDYFYEHQNVRNQVRGNIQKSKKLENAGKAWSIDEEKLLTKMYNTGATKKEMCETFKRTETGLAARLVHLGVIKDRDVFRGRK